MIPILVYPPEEINVSDPSSITILSQSYHQEIIKPTRLGLGVAIAIMTLLAISLIVLIFLNPSTSQLPWFEVLAAILWQTFLYTGLFITAHDAMHGSVYPNHPKINHAMGTIALWLYGFFSYKTLIKKHYLHHRYPASKDDPDFHDDQHQNFFLWYFTFIKNYLTWGQFWGFSFIFHSAYFLLKVPVNNLILFWIIPCILSSLQLFYFGTFLPHKEPQNGYQEPHRAQSNSLPTVLSFLTCYHFGYHEEHHQYPQVPWWRLPAIRKLTTTQPKS